MYTYNIKDLLKLQESGSKFVIKSTETSVEIISNNYIPGTSAKFVIKG